MLSHVNELVGFACFAHLAALETEFDAALFDVFLYYALVGMISPLPLKRVYSLNILNSIAQFNPESLVGSLDKLEEMVNDKNWEVLAQTLQLVTRLLEAIRSNMSGLAGRSHEATHRTSDRNSKRQPTTDPTETRRNI